MFDNASYFSSGGLTEFALEKGIRIRYSTNYYPRGNGLAESTNKNLLKIMKRSIVEHHRNWHIVLYQALWDDRVTTKSSAGNSPFFLLYGMEAILPPNPFLPSLQLARVVQETECSAIEERINMLLKLEEKRENAKRQFMKHQKIVKSWFDRGSSSNIELQVDDLVLKWDKAHEDKWEHTKFQRLWLGPYAIAEKLGPSTFRLQTLQG